MKRKSPIKLVLTIVLVLAAVIGCFGSYYFNKKLGATKLELETFKEEDTIATKIAYIALDDIKPGEELVQGENVEVQQYKIGAADSLLWNPGEEPSIATTYIYAGTPIFTTEATTGSVEKDARDYEVSVAELMVSQEDYDYVDIRITFPDGSDYIVVSKAQVENLSLPNSVFTIKASEADVQRMASAILDAYIVKGTRIYTTRYVESNLQDAATVTYPVKSATLTNLEQANNANVTELLNRATIELNKKARTSLEERLGTITEEDAQAADNAWEKMRQAFTEEVNRILEEEAAEE